MNTSTKCPAIYRPEARRALKQRVEFLARQTDQTRDAAREVEADDVDRYLRKAREALAEALGRLP